MAESHNRLATMATNYTIKLQQEVAHTQEQYYELQRSFADASNMVVSLSDQLSKSQELVAILNQQLKDMTDAWHQADDDLQFEEQRCADERNHNYRLEEQLREAQGLFDRGSQTPQSPQSTDSEVILTPRSNE